MSDLKLLMAALRKCITCRQTPFCNRDQRLGVWKSKCDSIQWAHK